MLTSADTYVQFKLKPKEKLDTNYDWKIQNKFMGQIILTQIICMWYNY